jgi:tetratricopeptide (TPR) repeat protein
MSRRKSKSAANDHRATPAAQRAYSEAVRLHQAGRGDEAGRLCEMAVLADDGHADSLHLLGVIATRRGDLDEARQRIGKAIGINDRLAPFHNSLGNVSQQQGRIDEAIASYRRAVALKPDFAQAHANLGQALKQNGEGAAAADCFRKAIDCKPDFVEAHSLLGGALQAAGKLEEAADAFSRTIELMPASPIGYFNLGNALREQGRMDDAILCHRKAVSLDPDYAEAHVNLGNELQECGLVDEAIACFHQAIALQPDYADAHNSLGNALNELGRVDEAIACHRKAIELKPGCAEYHNNLGIELQEQDAPDAAWEAYETAVALAPRRGIFYYHLVSTGSVHADSPHVARMQALAAEMDSLPEAEQVFLHFALGNVYGASGEVAKSFTHRLEGNRLKRRTIPYDEPGALEALGRLATIFTKDVLATGSRRGNDSSLPVFVLGMPRSGTTLVEQILASHPAVFGAGELMDLPMLLGQQRTADGVTNFAEAVAALKSEGLARLGSAYLEKLSAHEPSAARIVDKLPDNFMRVGFIHLALPRARIIHVRRDPVDTCLSCFSKLFVGMLPYTYDLAELGRYYRAYEALMAHWRAVLPPGAMLEVQYEDLVADLEGQTRRMLSYCDLPWDDRCLSFHKTKRTVKTASVTQVRQPLYGSSIGRWHAYADLARPLFDALQLDPAAPFAADT